MFSPKNSYSKEELVACSNGDLFTKEGDGRLPSDQMLMFDEIINIDDHSGICLLYTSPSPRDPIGSRMPSSA